jgi:hypothetical protein
MIFLALPFIEKITLLWLPRRGGLRLLSLFDLHYQIKELSALLRRKTP